MKYKFSPWKLFFSGGSTKANQIQEDKSFFCSELIASVYQHLNLLKPDLPASQYLPKSFSSDDQLPFLKGAKFGLEYDIEFL